MQPRLVLPQAAILIESREQCCNAGKALELSNEGWRGWQRVVESLYKPELLLQLTTTADATKYASKLLFALSNIVSTATLKVLVTIVHDHLLTHLHLLRTLVTWPHQRYELTSFKETVALPPQPQPLHHATTTLDHREQQQQLARQQGRLQRQQEADAAIAAANMQAVS